MPVYTNRFFRKPTAFAVYQRGMPSAATPGMALDCQMALLQ